MKNIGLSVLILILFLGTLPLDADQATSWKGQMKKVDGVTVIENPKKPISEQPLLRLVKDLRIGAEESRPEYMFSRIRSIAIDSRENMYIVDDKENKIKVFGRDGKFLRTIGRAGQGPGEYGRPYDIFITAKDEVIITDGERMLIHAFSIDGRWLASTSLRSFFPAKAVRDSQGNFYLLYWEQWRVGGGDYAGFFELVKLNPKLEKIASVAKVEIPPKAGSGVFLQIPEFAVRVDDCLVLGIKAAYSFKVVDPKGGVRMAMTKKFDPIPVSDEEREAAKKNNPELALDIPKYHPSFSVFFLDDAHRLFVGTRQKDKTSGAYIYDVFDPEGRFLCRIPIRGTLPCFMSKGKLYIADEDADGNPFLRRDKVVWLDDTK